jgi:hypothetical protein
MMASFGVLSFYTLLLNQAGKSTQHKVVVIR